MNVKGWDGCYSRCKDNVILSNLVHALLCHSVYKATKNRAMCRPCSSVCLRPSISDNSLLDFHVIQYRSSLKKICLASVISMKISSAQPHLAYGPIEFLLILPVIFYQYG